ncbi:MAG: exo-beta-N-acetylmuramidase NamZ domain-containing protein [Acidiferrobacterales bacterium]
MRTGLERLLDDPKRWLGQARVGLVANPTTIDHRLRHASNLLHSHADVDLRVLFGPEHGIRGAAQDMVGVSDAPDPETGLPQASLYGKTFDSLSPSPEHLSQIDVLVFDIQDVGARYYTYAATMALCMRAAKKSAIKVIVLDRPNPIGGLQIEGGGLEPGLENFCGLYPVPQRHGMTVGELARLYNDTFGIGCELDVVPCEGWRRDAYYDAYDLPWVMPSPNMPTLDTAIVYPGMCLLEGTNLSEGRGTTRPFELFGAPFVDGRALARELGQCGLAGVVFRSCVIEPTFHKFAGQRCGALQLHVVDRLAFDSFRTGLAVLVAVRKLWPDDLAWRTDAYEFRNDVPAIDLLTGNAAVRKAIDRGEDLETVTEIASLGTEAYNAGRARALLYD